MKEKWRGGWIPDKVATGILAVFCALAIMLAANTAEAGADIHYRVTGISVEPGKCIINGYFYNNGNAGAYVKKMHFTGLVDGVSLNATFRGNNISVGYVDSGGRRYSNFTIMDHNFKSYNSNPSHRDLESYVTFGN